MKSPSNRPNPLGGARPNPKTSGNLSDPTSGGIEETNPFSHVPSKPKKRTKATTSNLSSATTGRVNPNLIRPGTKPPTTDDFDDSFGTPAPTKKVKGKKSRNTKSPKKTKKVSKKFLIILGSSLAVLTAAGIYFLGVTAPVAAVDESTSGNSVLTTYVDCVAAYNTECLSAYSDPSYLVKETEYLNNNETRLEFVKHVLSTVSFTVGESPSLNWWGRPAITPFKHTPLVRPSTLSFGEAATYSYVDYAHIPVDRTKIQELIDKYKLTDNDFDYTEKVTDMFAEYITGIDELPLVTVERVPDLTCEGKNSSRVCKVGAGEDEFFDKALFSSDEFIQAQRDFAGNVWIALGADGDTAAPQLEGTWIGAYSLSGGGSTGEDAVEPRVGDGSFENPAGLNTPVKTFQYGADGKKLPIEVSLLEFRTGDAAFSVMEKRSQQNRGFTTESSIKYAYFRFQVRNISDTPLTIYANESLSDAQRTLTQRVGTVYGLTSYVEEVKPGATVVVESWTSSLNMDRLFLLWGSDFKRTDDPVWFRVLSAKESGTDEEPSSNPSPNPNSSETPSSDSSEAPSSDSSEAPSSDSSEAPSSDSSDDPEPDAEIDPTTEPTS